MNKKENLTIFTEWEAMQHYTYNIHICYCISIEIIKNEFSWNKNVWHITTTKNYDTNEWIKNSLAFSYNRKK